jgi:hypothetical protein
MAETHLPMNIQMHMHRITVTGLLVIAMGTIALTDDPAHKPLPHYDHIVIVIEENKDYEQITGSDSARKAAPYINDTLIKEGVLFTQIYGEEHNSQGNYFWLFSGGNQNVGFTDDIPTAQTNPQYPFHAKNLGEQLIKKALSFKAYSEDLPVIGFTGKKSPPDHPGFYARKHAPWVSFANLPTGTTVEASSNLRWQDFPTDFSTLPTVAIVVPNLKHDMHDGPADHSIPTGDTWLKDNLDRYYQWAKTHNSLLIVTFDENDNQEQYHGLTNPSVPTTEQNATPDSSANPEQKLRHDIRNHIATIFAGAHLRLGMYAESPGITHVNILRTLEAMYGLDRCGAQQQNAAGFGISDDYIIKDIFK